jgi:hypothetical protein
MLKTLGRILFEELKTIAVNKISKKRKSNFEITKRYKHALAEHIYESQNKLFK